MTRPVMLLLWSQASTRKHDARWQDTVAEAGFEVRPRGKHTYSIGTGRGSRSLTISHMIRAVHNDVGSDL